LAVANRTHRPRQRFNCRHCRLLVRVRGGRGKIPRTRTTPAKWKERHLTCPHHEDLKAPAHRSLAAQHRGLRRRPWAWQLQTLNPKTNHQQRWSRRRPVKERPSRKRAWLRRQFLHRNHQKPRRLTPILRQSRATRTRTIASGSLSKLQTRDKNSEQCPHYFGCLNRLTRSSHVALIVVVGVIASLFGPYCSS